MEKEQINALFNENGEWVEASQELKNLAMKFYAGLFTFNPSAWKDFIEG